MSTIAPLAPKRRPGRPTTRTTPTKRTSFVLGDDLVAELRGLADARGTTMAHELRSALRVWVATADQHNHDHDHES